MSHDRFKGQWNQVKGKARARWSKLTEDDLERVDGRIEQLVGFIQERHGTSKEEAERQVLEFFGSL